MPPSNHTPGKPRVPWPEPDFSPSAPRKAVPRVTGDTGARRRELQFKALQSMVNDQRISEVERREAAMKLQEHQKALEELDERTWRTKTGDLSEAQKLEIKKREVERKVDRVKRKEEERRRIEEKENGRRLRRVDGMGREEWERVKEGATGEEADRVEKEDPFLSLAGALDARRMERLRARRRE